MENEIIIGIDPSLNSTGICINRGSNKNPLYYNITNKCTKKLDKFKSKYINIVFYDKKHSSVIDYSQRELDKSYNIYNICISVKKIIKKYKPSRIIMEGLSYGSNGQLGDLGGLNFALRMVFIECGVDFVIVPPTVWKKQQIGIAGADKDIIIKTWKNLDNNIKDIQDIKLDDLADSYFLAHYIYTPPE